MAGSKVPKGFRIEDILSDQQDSREDSPKHEKFSPFVAPKAVSSAVSGKRGKAFVRAGKVFMQRFYCLFFGPESFAKIFFVWGGGRLLVVPYRA